MAGNDVLSEGEIDALMESVDDTSEPAASADNGEYRKFDFTGREYALLREFSALQTLVDRHFELFREALESLLSMECWVKVEPTALVSVNDAVASLERAVAVSQVTLEPLEEDAFVTAPASLLSGFVNAYFGGARNMGEPDTDRTSITTSEVRIAERIATQVIETLVHAWSEKIKLTPGAINTLEFPDRLAALPGDELLLRVRFVVTMGSGDGEIQLLIPFESLEPYREAFVPPKREKAKEKTEGTGWEQQLRQQLPSVKLEVAAVLDTHPKSLGAVMDLREGDIVPIDSPESVTVVLDGMEFAAGRYGTFEGDKAVQIDRITIGKEET